MNVLLSTTYFGPVQWYQKLHRADAVLIDADEHFAKQTYRNRCVIATANGPQTLTIPVAHDGQGLATRTRDVRISDHGNWRHVHWQALTSAYGESPFFCFLADDLRPFFERRWEFLLDFNMAITQKVCELLDISPHVASALPVGADVCDYRRAICPKHPQPDPDFAPRSYYQVYGLRHGFLPNMSILDLLFNMGNESVLYL